MPEILQNLNAPDLDKIAIYKSTLLIYVNKHILGLAKLNKVKL